MQAEAGGAQRGDEQAGLPHLGAAKLQAEDRVAAKSQPHLKSGRNPLTVQIGKLRPRQEQRFA